LVNFFTYLTTAAEIKAISQSGNGEVTFYLRSFCKA